MLTWAKRDDDANGEQFATAQQIRQVASQNTIMVPGFQL